MVLIDPNIDYIGIFDEIINLLKNNLSSLNVGLTAGTFSDSNKDRRIKAGTPGFNTILKTDFPSIWVKINRKSETFAALGGGARKRASITYTLYGIVYSMKSGIDDDYEIMRLTKNIEGIFRKQANIQLNSKVLWCSPGDVDFAIMQDEMQTYISVVAIDLNCEIEIK